MDNVQVNMSLWPRFKMVFDLHLNSLRNANIKTLWEDDVHPHYVTRRYAEFIASLLHLNVEHGDGQVSCEPEILHVHAMLLSNLPFCSLWRLQIWASVCSLILVLSDYEWLLRIYLSNWPRCSLSRSCRLFS
jgi:hypothetical protein